MIYSAQQQVPKTLRVPKRLLIGESPTRMWNCESTPTTYGDSLQGNFHIAPRASATCVIMVQCWGVCEYFSPTVNRLDLRLLKKKREDTQSEVMDMQALQRALSVISPSEALQRLTQPGQRRSL
jgi:hypothetical protein